MTCWMTLCCQGGLKAATGLTVEFVLVFCMEMEFGFIRYEGGLLICWIWLDLKVFGWEGCICVC